MNDDAATRLPIPFPVIPIILDQDIPNGIDLLTELTRITSAAVRELPSKSIPQDFVERLLETGRLLVLIDGLSELNDRTHELLQLNQTNLVCKACILTSRSDDLVHKLDALVLQPSRIGTASFSHFMDVYLTGTGKRALFADTDFIQILRQLQRILGSAPLTPLMARLYAELAVVSKEQGTLSGLPTGAPDLIRRYVKNLNVRSTVTYYEDYRVQEDLKAIAWECIRLRLEIGVVKRSQAQGAIVGDDTEIRLDYLISKLGVLEVVGSDENALRFSLDPIGEYFAAMRVSDSAATTEETWKLFVSQVRDWRALQGQDNPFFRCVTECLSESFQKDAVARERLSELTAALT